MRFQCCGPTRISTPDHNLKCFQEAVGNIAASRGGINCLELMATFFFFKLPLSCSPICSHWDFNQGNMQDGPREWCSPWRSLSSSEQLWSEPSCYHTVMRDARCNICVPPRPHPRSPYSSLCRVENISGGISFSSREHWKPSGPSRLHFSSSENKTLLPFNVPHLMLPGKV